MPDGLHAQPRAGDLLIGPLGTPLPDETPIPRFAGRETETTSLDVGPDYRVTQLPTRRTIIAPELEYTSRWSVVGNTVTVRRELVSHVSTPLCEGTVRKTAAEALEGNCRGLCHTRRIAAGNGDGEAHYRDRHAKCRIEMSRRDEQISTHHRQSSTPSHWCSPTED